MNIAARKASEWLGRFENVLSGRDVPTVLDLFAAGEYGSCQRHRFGLGR